jgi:hypothetical protein
VEVIAEVPDADQDLMVKTVPRAITERFWGTAVSVLEIRVQNIPVKEPIAE